MFRWLALCLVLCAGAFALVAMATGAVQPPRSNRRATCRRPSTAAEAAPMTPFRPRAGAGLGRGGAVFIKDARLTAIEREEVPSQHDGTMLVVGTDEPAEAKSRPRRCRPSACPSWRWRSTPRTGQPGRSQDAAAGKPVALPPLRPPDSKFQEAFNQARLGNSGTTYKNAAALKIYRRWHEGDPLQPGRSRWRSSRRSSAS